MVTKRYSAGFPEFKDFKETLKKLPEYCERLTIKDLAIPKIGCGLDTLSWERVMKVLKAGFMNSNTTVTVVAKGKEDEGRHIREGNRRRKMPNRTWAQTDILGDSHARGLGPLLGEGEPISGNEFYSSPNPGKTTEEITKEMNMVTARLEPQDNLVLISGTNDIKEREGNEVEIDRCEEARRAVLSQALHCKVFIATVPYRYDKPELNQYIDSYNETIRKQCTEEAEELKKIGMEERIKIIEVNSVLEKKRLYRAWLASEKRREGKTCKLD